MGVCYSQRHVKNDGQQKGKYASVSSFCLFTFGNDSLCLCHSYPGMCVSSYPTANHTRAMVIILFKIGILSANAYSESLQIGKIVDVYIT